MKRQFILLLLLSFQFVSCKSQTDTERIENTCREVIAAISQLDTSKFISLIGRSDLRDISKTEEMVGFDVTRFNQLFNSKIDSFPPKFILTETYNSLGQRKVVVPIFEKMDGYIRRTMHLNLLFGPPDYFSLDKLSGYSLIINNSDSLDFKALEYWKRSQ